MEDQLADYAVKSALTRGRVHSEASPSGRTEFQRDRDRLAGCRQRINIMPLGAAAMAGTRGA